MEKNFSKFEFNSEGGSSSFTVSVIGQCEGDKEIKCTPDANLESWANVTRDGDKITVSCKGSTTTDHRGYLTLSLNDDTCTSDKIECVQKSPSCGCGNFQLSTYSVSWPSSSSASSSVTYSEKGGCITEIKASSDSDHFKVADDTTNGITITPNNTNPNSGPITGNVTVTYKANGGTCDVKTINLIHQGSDCGCGSFDMDTSTITWDSDEGRSVVKSKTYTENCVTVYEVSVGGTDRDHFHATNNGHKIEVYPDNTNTDESSKNATVTVKYKTDTVSDCGSKSFSVVHNGTGCECGNLEFKVDGTSSSSAVWDYNESGEQKAKTITYEIKDGKASCIASAIEFEVVGDGFYSQKIDAHTIKVWPIEDNPSEDPITATVQYSYTLTSGRVCDGSSDAVSLIQVENDYCQCTHLSVGCARKTFAFNAKDQYGYSQTYILANGDTNNCGEFTEIKYDGGSTRPSWLTADTVHTSETGRQVIVMLKYDPYQTKARSCDIKYVFKRKRGDVVLGNDCDYSFAITQTNDYIDCNRLNESGMKAYSSSTLSYLSGNKRVGELAASDSSARETFRILKANDVLKDTSFSVPTSAQTWISNFSTEFKYEIINGDEKLTHIYINADVTENDTTSNRETTVTLRLDSSKLKEVFGICNCGGLVKTFPVTQKYNESAGSCDCNESTTATRNENSGPGETNYLIGNSYPCSCFKEGESKYILADSASTIIVGSDTEYQPIPYYSNWLSGRVETYTQSSKCYAKLYLNRKENTSTSARTAVFYVIYNLDNEGVCKKLVEFTQEGKVVNCSALNDIIKEVGARPYSNANDELVAYASDLLIPNTKLSGRTISSTAAWVERVFPDSSSDTALNADLKDNMTTSGDGATSARSTTVQVFFVDENGNYVNFNGTDCTGKTITIKQQGYTGACPLATSMSISNMIPSYDGYGDLMPDGTTHWTCNEEGLGVLPAFHAGNSKELFECNLNGCTTEYKGNIVPCYTVSATVTDVGYVNFVSAVQDATDKNKYVIKGSVYNHNRDKSVPVIITLTLMKYDYLNGGRLIPTSITRQCHVSVLPTDKDCQGQPIS